MLHRLEAELLCGVAKCLTGVNASGAVPPASDTSTFVFYANHTSHLDAVVLWMSLPSELRYRTRPVAARDYWQRNAFRRHLANDVFNALLVDRGQGAQVSDRRAIIESFNTMGETLAGGRSLIIFPEGTRGTGEKTGQFKSGLYRLAKRYPHVVFVPVFLDNLNRILPKGESLPVPLLGAARFGDGIRIYKGENKRDFLSRCHTGLNSLGEGNVEN